MKILLKGTLPKQFHKLSVAVLNRLFSMVIFQLKDVVIIDKWKKVSVIRGRVW